MKKKDYLQSAEDQGLNVVSEPVAGEVRSILHKAHGNAQKHDCIDDLDWNNLPVIGPSSEEDAIARIDKFEERLKNGQVKWYSSEEVDKQIYEKYPWLR